MSEIKICDPAKPIYAKPAIIDLGKAARSQGACASGSGDVNCSTGTIPSSSCGTGNGVVGGTLCQNGTSAITVCGTGTGYFMILPCIAGPAGFM